MAKTNTDDKLIEETQEAKEPAAEEKPKKKASRKRTSRKKAESEATEAAKEEKPKKKTTRKRTSKKKTAEESSEKLQLELDLKPEAVSPSEPEPEAETASAPEPETETVSEPAPAEEPGEKVISLDDYQPIIWVDGNGSGEPDEKAEEAAPEAEPVSEQEEKPAYDADELLSGRPAPHAETFAAVFRLFGTAFIAVLMIVFVLNIIVKDKTYSDQENRVFQQFPSFSLDNYLAGRFESQLDNYASDQFAGRDLFIKIKSAADLSIGQLKANGVFKAKDSYLFEDIVYPDRKGEDADIEALKAFKEKYKGKKMYFMLVPNAANILKEKLPAGVTTRDQNKDLDAFFTKAEKLGYKTIDVRDELNKAKDKTQVYYRTDHHWTTDGAYEAYLKAAKVMKLKSGVKYRPYVVKKDFAGTLYSKSGFTNGKNDAIKIYLPEDDKALRSVIRYKDTKEKTTKYYVMENLDKKDAYTVFGGTNQSLFSISTPTKANRNLLVVKDSYANCFIPFLTQDYRTITVVDPRYYYENIATVIKANDIDEVLFLYNANTFFSDNYMRMMLTNK